MSIKDISKFLHLHPRLTEEQKRKQREEYFDALERSGVWIGVTRR